MAISGLGELEARALQTVTDMAPYLERAES